MAARVIIVFTDASFKETMSILEAKGGSFARCCERHHGRPDHPKYVRPNFGGYDRLSQTDMSEWEVVEYESLSP